MLKVLCEIDDTASFTPVTVGESPEWASIVDSAEENAATFCKALSGKPFFSALHGIYTVALGELKISLKKCTRPEEGDVVHCGTILRPG
jgi:hypothetical protein